MSFTRRLLIAGPPGGRSTLVRLAAGLALTGMLAFPGRATGIEDHLQCFKMRDPLALKGYVELDPVDFGLRPECKITRGQYLCVPAKKTVSWAKSGLVPIFPRDLWSPPAPGERICYRVRCPGEEVREEEMTDQFGARALQLGPTKLVCTPAVEGADPEPRVFFGFPATGQSTCWLDGTEVPCAMTPGQDGAVQAGARLRYVDNGDGTITDRNTGLMWEKKSLDGSLHDVDRFHPFGDFCNVSTSRRCLTGADCPAGETCSLTSPHDTIFEWVARLNEGSGFAGHTDWRIPNVRELVSLFDHGPPGSTPLIAKVFDKSCTAGCDVLTCSCTQHVPESIYEYWSSTSAAEDPAKGIVVSFDVRASRIEEDFKESDYYHARAVRGGQ